MDYSPEVQRRLASLRRARGFASAAPGTVRGEAEDRALNVWIRFQVQVREGVIETARFQVYGCPHLVAAASWLAEWLEGRPVEALGRWSVHQVAAALDVPVAKLGKLLRLEDAVCECARQLERAPAE